MKPSIRTLATATMMAATALAGMTVVAAAADKPVIATVVKIAGIPWFDRLETGVKAFQAANPDVIAVAGLSNGLGGALAANPIHVASTVIWFCAALRITLAEPLADESLG